MSCVAGGAIGAGPSTSVENPRPGQPPPGPAGVRPLRFGGEPAPWLGPHLHPPPCTIGPGASARRACHFLWVLVLAGAFQRHRLGGPMFSSLSSQIPRRSVVTIARQDLARGCRHGAVTGAFSLFSSSPCFCSPGPHTRACAPSSALSDTSQSSMPPFGSASTREAWSRLRWCCI